MERTGGAPAHGVVIPEAQLKSTFPATQLAKPKNSPFCSRRREKKLLFLYTLKFSAGGL